MKTMQQHSFERLYVETLGVYPRFRNYNEVREFPLVLCVNVARSRWRPSYAPLKIVGGNNG